MKIGVQPQTGLSSSGEMTKVSVGSGEQFLSSGDQRGAVFARRGRERGRLSGHLIQGIFWLDIFRTRNSLLQKKGKIIIAAICSFRSFQDLATFEVETYRFSKRWCFGRNFR